MLRTIIRGKLSMFSRPIRYATIAAFMMAMPVADNAMRSQDPGVQIVKGQCRGCEVPFRLGQIQFVTERDGWSSAYYLPSGGNGSGQSTILRTRDGGRHWRQMPFIQRSAEDEPPFAFVGAHGWIASFDSAKAVGRLSRTTDGGRSWSHRESGPLSHLRFFDERHGYSVEGTLAGSRFRATADGGDTWSIVDLPVTHVDVMSFADPRTGILAGRSQISNDSETREAKMLRVLVTNDDGLHWAMAQLPIGSDGVARTCEWIDSRTAFMAIWRPNDGGSDLLETSDGGATWSRHPDESLQGTGKYISAIVFTSAQAGYLFYADERTQLSYIASTADRGKTWHNNVFRWQVSSCDAFRKDVLCTSGMSVIKLAARRAAL